MKTPISHATLKKAERWGLILVALTVLVTVGITIVTSSQSLGTSLARMPWPAVGLLAVATFIETALRFHRYHVAGKALHLQVPWHRMLYYYTVGFALIPTPGKIGTAVRLWLLRQYHGLPYSRTTPLMIMDLVSDSLAIFSLAAVCLLVLNDPALQVVGILITAALVTGLFATLIAPRFMARSLKAAYWATGRRKPRLFARLLTLVRTTAQVLGPRTLFLTTLLSFTGWGLVGLAVAYLVQQMGIPAFTIPQGILALTLSNVGGFITMMPAGVIGAEGTMVWVLTQFAVPLGLAVLVTAVTRLIVLWSTVLIGLIFLPIAIRRAPRRLPAPKPLSQPPAPLPFP